MTTTVADIPWPAILGRLPISPADTCAFWERMAAVTSAGAQIVEEITIPSGLGPGEKMPDVEDEDGVATHKRVRFNPKSAEDSEPELCSMLTF